MTYQAKPESTGRELRPYLLLARILGAHALHGELKVEVLTDREDGLHSITDCWLLSDPDDQDGQRTTILNVRAVDGSIIALEGIEQREQALKLKGSFLAVARSEAYADEEDVWYVPDLIGCIVYDESGEKIGRVRDVIQSSSNGNLAVQRPGKKELLVPVLKSVIQSVDVSAGTIKVKLPEGLLEIYED